MHSPVELRRSSIAGIDALAAGLFWHRNENILMVWGYYDESGEYDAAGNLVNMTVGGCFSSLDKWREFEPQWKEALAREGLTAFHMTDFEAWRPPFDLKLADGSRDDEKHKRLLVSLLEIMLRYTEGLYGFGALVPPINDRGRAHNLLLEDCIVGAISHAINEVWDRYGQPVNLVFAKQRHFPESQIKKVIGLYDYGEGSGRIRTQSIADVDDVPPLQAADILAYEMARAQRADRPDRYPFKRMQEAAKSGQLQMTIKWGHIRARRDT